MQAAKTKVFISYARRDAKFVDRLDRQLRGAAYSVIIDRKDIAAAEIWRRRLDAMIVSADAVIFVISPHSVKSEECAKEIARITELGKRLVPLVWQDIGALECPVALSAPNWVHAKQGDFGAALDVKSFALVRNALDTDIEWVREHGRLTELAERWRVTNSAGSLLHGQDIAAAVEWRAHAPSSDTTTTELLHRFIDVSVDHARAQALADQREAFRLNLSVSDALSEKAASHMREGRHLQASCLLAAAQLQNPLIADRATFLSLAEDQDAERARRLARTQSSDLIDLDRRIPLEHVERFDLAGPRGGALQFDLAGGQVLVSTFQGLARWDLRAKKWSEFIITERDPIGVFLPGREAAALCEDGALVVRDLDSGAEKQRAKTAIDPAKSFVRDIVFSLDGRYIAVNAGPIFILDRASGAVSKFSGDEQYFSAYGLAPVTLDGATCFLIGLAGEIGVYDCAHGGYAMKLPSGVRFTLDAVMYDDASARFFAGGTAQKIVAVRKGETPVLIGEHDDKITSLTPLPSEQRFVSTGWDGAAYVWRLDTDEKEISIPNDTTMDEPGISASAVSEDGAYLAVLENTGRINVWRRRTLARDARLAHDNTILSIAPDPANPTRLAAAGFVGPSAAIWTKSATGWSRRELPLSAPMRHAAYSADGRRLAICGDVPDVAIFDANGALLRTLRVAGEFVSEGSGQIDARNDMIACVTLSADGAQIAWTAPGGAVQLGDPQTGRVRVLVEAGQKDFERIVFAPSGQSIYGATSQGAFMQIGLDGALRLICEGIPRPSTFGKGPAIAVSKDGMRLAVSGEENSIRVFGADGALELTLEGHREKFKRGWSESVAGLAFSPDRRLLVSSGSRQSGGDDRRTVRLWDMQTGDQIWRRFVLADLLAADFSADGRRLFVVVEKEIEVVELDTTSLAVSPAARLTRAEAMLGAKWTTLF